MTELEIKIERVINQIRPYFQGTMKSREEFINVLIKLLEKERDYYKNV